MDNRDGARAAGVCYEAGKEIGSHLAFACARLGLDDPEQTGRETRELFRACFKSTRYCASLSSIWTGSVLAVATVPPMTPRRL